MATIVRDPSTLSTLEAWLSTLDPRIDRATAVQAFLAATPAGERYALGFAWSSFWARPAQRMPALPSWRTWLIRAGRGFGKTRTGAEAVRRLVDLGKARAVTIVGPTAADARDVMIEGPDSGLLAVHPNETRPLYEPSKRLLTWPNGCKGHVRSAEEPDSLRGLQSEVLWGDEPASWKSGVAAWDNATLGNRLGDPHAILTGTPRPLPWLRKLEAERTSLVTTGSTYENIANLAPAFIEMILGRYEDTRLGMQELHAQYLEDVEGAMWRMATIEANRTRFVGDDGRENPWNRDDPWRWLERELTLEHRLAAGLGAWHPAKGERRPWVVWVAVDPPGETAECGIVVGTAPRHAKANSDHAIVLDDMTVAGPPEVWGARVVEAVKKWGAEGAVVERNQGGDMVRSTIHAVDPTIVVEKITASESKADRAEPVSMLDARGWVHHHGTFGALESQMTTWVPKGSKDADGNTLTGDSKSPDRLDARVHLITKLLSVPKGRGRGVATVYSPV